MTAPHTWGIGVDSRAGPNRVLELAQLADSLGYTSFWFNVIGADQDPFPMLEAVVAGTERIDVGIGVIPLDLHPPGRLSERLSGLSFDVRRAILGLGSGAARERPLGLVKAGLEQVRSAIPELRLAVGGMGPRMISLGAAQADALVLSMMPFGRAHAAQQRISAGAGALPAVYAYHRVTTDTEHGQDMILAEMVSHGALPDDAPPPGPDDLLGTVARSHQDVAAGLTRYPHSWRPVLRPLARADRELPDLFRRFAPVPG
ncbi:LLM class flavin-dependent oxidoreductase [Streptomyces sp. NPDC047081]|uniref:LLM class flavin-dependent oxidoreductase n=1 Tax=Streptomyces sp. NPDC047081 TaxID=3154706 RepID=UPI003401C2EC